jgi:hypothetical protein
VKRAPNYARTCRRKKHTIPAGVLYCKDCKQELQALRRQQFTQKHEYLPSYLRGTLPPAEVTAGAACSPEIAYLFDPVEKGNPDRMPGAERDRIAAGRSVCQDCPVIAECFADAVASKRMGVYGGVYLSPKWYEKRRSEVVVQSVKSA